VNRLHAKPNLARRRRFYRKLNLNNLDRIYQLGLNAKNGGGFIGVNLAAITNLPRFSYFYRVRNAVITGEKTGMDLFVSARQP
jgi:hypothetical protein